MKDKLDEEFQYISSSKKLKDEIPVIKNVLLKDASRKFFESEDAKSYIKRYVEMKDNPFFNEIYQKHFNIFSEFWNIHGETYFADWVDMYLKPIRITLTLFLNKDSRDLELKKFGIEKENKKIGKSGRPFKEGNKAIFKLVPIFKNSLESNRFKKRESGETAAIKEICKLLRIPFKHSIVTAYNNQKLKYKSE